VETPLTVLALPVEVEPVKLDLTLQFQMEVRVEMVYL
jgi:hypothetical protein